MGRLMQVLEQILATLQRVEAKTVPSTDREIMSLAQAAQYLGQSPWTIREWVRMKQIPFSKINGTLKFRKSKLDRWLELKEISSR